MDRLTKQVGIGIIVAMMVVLGAVIFEITSAPLGASSSCSITGEGAIYFRVVSDTGGEPVQGANLSGFETYVCGGSQETWQASSFVQQSGGWFAPVLPSGAAEAGQFSVTAQYSGRSYTAVGQISPLQVTCLTLRVPSGNYSSAMYTANNALSQCLSH